MAWSVCKTESIFSLALMNVLLALISCTNLNSPPKISIHLPHSPNKGVLTLSEDTPLNSYLTLLETKDDDMGPAGEVECRTDNAFINIPLVYPKAYKIELAKELDRETVSVFQVEIVCSDKGTPAMTATEGFTVNVVDVNDNSPIFGNSSYSANVTEGADVGTLVTTITATDPDAELNGIVQYSIYNDSYENSTFTIDKETGQILTNTELDREMINQYIITVVATDSGQPARSTTVVVNIKIDDINDNAPVVVTQEIHVKENQKPMMAVGRVTGSDLDAGKNAQLVFSKVENSQSSSLTPFLVQPDGEILSAVSLNREQKPQYIMEIEVKDRGHPRKSSTATVTIIVDDVNDNIPFITNYCLYDIDGASLNNYSLINNSTDGVVIIDWFLPDDKKVVYQVQAEDQDLGENSHLRFSIESATSGNRFNRTTTLQDILFKINETTGEIFLRRVVRKTDQLHQFVNISVADRGSPPLIRFCALSITVNVDVKQLGTATTTRGKGKPPHKRTRKYRNGASDFGFVGVTYLIGDGGVICFVLTCVVVNYVFRC